MITVVTMTTITAVVIVIIVVGMAIVGIVMIVVLVVTIVLVIAWMPFEYVPRAIVGACLARPAYLGRLFWSAWRGRLAHLYLDMDSLG